MRSPIRKEVVALFARELQEKCPQFERFSRKSPIWARQLGLLTFFVLLQPFQRSDRFAIEVAWSEDGEFPWGSIGEIDVRKPRGRDRLPCWEEGVQQLEWDLAPEHTSAIEEKIDRLACGEYVPYTDTNPPIEVVLPRIEPAVQDAVHQLVKKGLPFLRRVAKHRGLKWEEEL
jgi:hypothetical protein